MPVINKQDASDVEDHIGRIFRADSTEERSRQIRRLFVEKLDFEQSSGVVSLEGAPQRVDLPATAHRIAELEEAHVVYVHLDTSRVRKAEASEAARLVSDQLGGDVLMVFTNGQADQLHFIYPTFDGLRPTLRRMIVERDLPRRTAVMQIANIFHQWESSGSIHLALESAFDVEAVTREFFKEYKRVFDAALDKIGGFGSDESGQEDKKLFTQTLFNRLMFVYFISRKGWLSFDGDKDYLKALWRDYAAKADDADSEPNFRYDRLRPLFFGGLNNDGSQDLTDYPDARRLIGSVPFLNGGLFEETGLDRRTEVTVPDDVIRSIFDDLFDRFNFTVMESTPFDIEVAVDPEMLGKVFEELVTGRHDSGSYYTPRPVVSFMCREALKGYLEGRDTTLPAEAISAFVDDHDTSGVTVAAARSVGRALDEITVVDPACGSGAYLLGMMQELVELQTELYNAGLDPKSLYDLKLQIIERNLYGVDIDEFAVNIAMLRLWLSLAIEYEGEAPEPLPNLDLKIVCGDSLLGPCPDPSELNREFTEHVARVLGERKSEFMRTTDGSRKDELKTEIASREQEYAEWLGASSVEDELDWRIEFADVFALRGGFDVAVANPPYVESRSSSIEKASKEAYGRRFLADWSVSLPKGSDLFIYFFARAAQLLSFKGKAAFITQNGWLSSNYGKTFQDFTMGRVGFRRIVDTTSRFFAQSGGPNINAVISFFDRTDSNTIEYQMVNDSLTIQSSRVVYTRENLKWGHLFGMPDWFREILAELTALENPSRKPPLEFGQGINVPKGRHTHNMSGGKIGIIVETPKFGCFEPDAYVLKSDLSKARLGRAPALMMPRGIGRYYCSLNKCQAFSYSGVELYLPVDMWESDLHYCLWLYLNSSFGWLFRELTGRTNLGGGMLKAEATDMKAFPVRFDFDFGNEARKMFADVSNERPLAIEEELHTSHHRRIDEIIGKYFAFDNRLDDIRTLLIEKVGFRVARASGRA